MFFLNKKAIIILSTVISCGSVTYLIINDSILTRPVSPTAMSEENDAPVERKLYRDEIVRFQFIYPDRIAGKLVMPPVKDEQSPTIPTIRVEHHFHLFENELYKISFSVTELTKNTPLYIANIPGVASCGGASYDGVRDKWRENRCSDDYDSEEPTIAKTLNWEEFFVHLQEQASPSGLPVIETESGQNAYPYSSFDYGSEGVGYRIFDLDRMVFFDISLVHGVFVDFLTEDNIHDSPEYIKFTTELEAAKEFLQAVVKTVQFF